MQEENTIELWGRTLSKPFESHVSYKTTYYKLPFAVPRLSGTEDVVNLILSRGRLEGSVIEPDQWLRVVGSVRSYNNTGGETGNRLVITVLVQELAPAPAQEGVNHLILSGVLCKPPVRRRTPLGREICDLLLAVNRPYSSHGYRKADYLPCIAWGTLADACGHMAVGDQLRLKGRLQSREYRKTTENGDTVTRVAYEVSIMELLEKEQHEQL